MSATPGDEWTDPIPFGKPAPTPTEGEEPTRPKWTDLIGIDPDYLEGKSVDEWLDEQRGEA